MIDLVSRIADVLLVAAMALVALAGVCLHVGWPALALVAGLFALPFVLTGVTLRALEHVL